MSQMVLRCEERACSFLFTPRCGPRLPRVSCQPCGSLVHSSAQLSLTLGRAQHFSYFLVTGTQTDPSEGLNTWFRATAWGLQTSCSGPQVPGVLPALTNLASLQPGTLLEDAPP